MTNPWQNRIVGYEAVDPLTLRAHTKNIRTHASAQRRLLESALDELGHVGAIVVSQRTRRVLNGHLRVELAIGRDEPTIPVTWIDVDEAEELVVLAFFDQIGEQAEIDAAKLKQTFSQVTAGSDGLQTMLADWAASYAVTIVPAKPTVIAPPPPAPVALAPASVTEVAPVAAAPVAAVPLAAPEKVAGGMPAGEVRITIPAEAPAPDAPAATESTAPASVPVVEPSAAAPIAAAPLPTAAALPPLPAAEPEAPVGLVLEELTFDGEENPFVDMFATALAADHPVVIAAPAPVAEAVVAKKTKAQKPAPPAPTTTVITIGEYDQEIDLATFNPWFNALVESCGGDGYKLTQQIKLKLGIAA
jgi:hypothetical protein